MSTICNKIVHILYNNVKFVFTKNLHNKKFSVNLKYVDNSEKTYTVYFRTYIKKKYAKLKSRRIPKISKRIKEIRKRKHITKKSVSQECARTHRLA